MWCHKQESLKAIPGLYTTLSATSHLFKCLSTSPILSPFLSAGLFRWVLETWYSKQSELKNNYFFRGQSNIHFADLEVEELLSHSLISILFYQVQFNIVEAGPGTEKMLMHIGEFKWFAILSNLLAGVSIWLASWGNLQWSLLNPWGTLVQITKEHRSHFSFPLSFGHCPMLNGRGLARNTG